MVKAQILKNAQNGIVGGSGNNNQGQNNGGQQYSSLKQEQLMNGYFDSNGVWKEVWQLNY